MQARSGLGVLVSRPALDRREVILDLNSERIVRALPPDYQDGVIASMQEKGFYTIPHATGVTWGGHTGYVASTFFDAGRFGGKPIIERELSEEERTVIRTLLHLVRERGPTLHLVDVGKQSHLRRFVEEHLHPLREFPVLFRSDGQRLEGLAELTPDKVTSFLSG